MPPAVSSAARTSAPVGRRDDDRHCLIATVLDWPSALVLPLLLAQSGARISTFSPGPLGRNTHVTESTICPRDPVAAAALLRDFLANREFDLVIFADEQLLRQMVENPGPPQNARWLPVDPSDAAVVELLFSKIAFVKRAADLGITVPEWSLASTATEARTIAEGLGFPVMVKGDGGAGGSEIRFCPDARALRAASDEFLARYPHVIVQRFIDGYRVCAAVLYDHGRVAAYKPYRAECFHPTIYAASNVHSYFKHDAMERTARSFGAATRFHGMAAFDFFFDGNELYALEFNPRQTMGFAGSGASRDFFAPVMRRLLRGETLDETQVYDGRKPRQSHFPGYFFYLINTRPKITTVVLSDIWASLREVRREHLIPSLWLFGRFLYMRVADRQPELRAFVRKCKLRFRSRR